MELKVKNNFNIIQKSHKNYQICNKNYIEYFYLSIYMQMSIFIFSLCKFKLLLLI